MLFSVGIVGLFTAMLTYTAAELIGLCHSQPPPRPARKALFQFGLWLPRDHRLPVDQLIGVYKQRHVLYPEVQQRRPNCDSMADCAEAMQIPTLVGRRPSRPYRPPPRKSVITAVALQAPTQHHDTAAPPQRAVPPMPTLYVLNAAALSTPGAVDHLATDLKSIGAPVAVITETHFKQKYADSVIGIDGYTLFRRDRVGRRGGGVALYVQNNIQASIWLPSLADSREFELLWVRVGPSLFVAALYHPPRPVYSTADLLSYIENCVAELTHDYPLADIILAGDLNQLSDADVVERTGFTQIVRQPTRSASLLDRVFVSNPQLYNTVRVVSSLVKSDHKAVVAIASGAAAYVGKTRRRDRNAYYIGRKHRRRTQAFCSIWRRLTSALDLTKQSSRGRQIHKHPTTHSTPLLSDCWRNFIQSAPSP